MQQNNELKVEDNWELNPIDKKQDATKAWLLLSQVIAVFSLFIWFVWAGLSMMAFDGGVTRFATIIVTIIWLYPLWPIFFTIIAWKAYYSKKYRTACILTTFTFIPVAMFALFLKYDFQIYHMIDQIKSLFN